MSASDCGQPCCGCCAGVGGATPVFLENRPGLSALAYRVGTHSLFKEAMLAEISAKPTLRGLTTRDDDDPTIGLLDAWAVTLDVLTFYQERIANEGFLRTATERRSLLELARTIGYELGPGVASSTWLAFTLDGSPGSPREVTIPAGTRAQSLPTKSELPQSFETGEPLLARPEWNALRPRQTERQLIQGTEILLAGLATQLRPGDALLFVDTVSKDGNLRILTAVEAKSEQSVTRVAWQSALTVPDSASPKVYALRQRAALFGANAPDWKAMTADFKKAYMDAVGFQYGSDPKSWPTEWPKFDLTGTTDKIDLDASYPRIAPKSWAVMKASQEKVFRVDDVVTISRSDYSLSARVTRLDLSDTFEMKDFPVRQTAVFAESEELAPAPRKIEAPVEGKTIELDGLVGGLAPGRTVIVQGKRMRAKVNAKSLTLKAEDGSREVGLKDGETLEVLARSKFSRRFFFSKLSETWRLRDRNGFEGILGPVKKGKLTLVPAEKTDPEAAEVAFLEEPTSDKERTTLHLTEPLKNLFDRTTVSIFANVAAATHGETRREVLGAGDAVKKFQRFRLRQKPLTYVPAPVPSGGESTLELRVNGVRWHESPDFYRLGPRDRKYVLRRDDEGNTTVGFGDGVHGARLPSGVENVDAVYRTGIGLAGLVGENRISLLATRPLGVKSVNNPVPATGAADPEGRDQARRNAPMTVLTLDRVVSLRDYEDFARSFSGIGKAQARMLWQGGRRLVHLTLAGVGGSAVEEGTALSDNLREALNRLRDPFQPLVIESFERLLFRVKLRVKVHPDHVKETVLQRVETALREAFSFEARDFGQSVHLSGVMAVAQRAEGVVYVDVDRLYQDGLAETLEDRLPALPARIGDAGEILRGQILLLSPVPVEPEAIP